MISKNPDDIGFNKEDQNIPQDNISNRGIDNNENNNIDNNDKQNEEGLKDDIEEEEDEDLGEKENSITRNKEEKMQTESEGGVLEKIFLFLKSGFAWRPIPTITETVLCLEITGAILLTLGILIFVLSRKIVQIELRYDDKCKTNELECKIPFTISKNMAKNVMVYYRLTNFYQNHRRYIKSKSISQLKGEIKKESDIKDDCDPIILNKDLYPGVKSVNGKELDPEKVAHPCGLIARSFFNDSFSIQKEGTPGDIIISNENIAWTTDKKKFKNSENWNDIQWLDVENERFIVWMRPAALPDFRKLWGRIEVDLSPGNYILTVKNIYPVESFKGKKYFIISTVNALGGKNYFLALIYLVVAAISILSGIGFFLGYRAYNSDKIAKVD